MPKLTRHVRPEPPLTAHVRAPQGRVEPPLTARLAQAPAAGQSASGLRAERAGAPAPAARAPSSPAPGIAARAPAAHPVSETLPRAAGSGWRAALAPLSGRRPAGPPADADPAGSPALAPRPWPEAEAPAAVSRDHVSRDRAPVFAAPASDPAPADPRRSVFGDRDSAPAARADRAAADPAAGRVVPRRVAPEVVAAPALFRAPPPTLLAETRAQGPARPAAPGQPAAAPARPRRAAAPGRQRDPAPSRLSYRMHRLWLTPVYRALFQVGVPAFALAMGVGLYLSDEGRRAALAGTGAEAIRAIQERPEFMVNLMAVEGASPELGETIRTVLPVDFPVSSFDLDLEAMRATVAELDAVASADLRIRPGGILEVRIEERVPAILWRGPTGLTLLDETGHTVAPAGSRLERPDLPVIAGDGAERAVPEAMALLAAAEPVGPRIRGLVRMGERRWDVVLDGGQRILLPEAEPVAALERVMALAQAEDMLARDVSVIDMRYGQRPTLRLNPDALDRFRRGQEVLTGATSG